MKTKLMKDLRDSLSENIVLCGRDELGQRNRLISKCNIAATFSNADFDSISNIMKIKKNSKQVSIVLGDGAIAKWSSVLSGAGLRYGKDFIDAMSFERIVARMEGYQCPKELVVAYGNCQMHDYFDCLNRTTSFVAKYESAYFKYSEYPRWQEDYMDLQLILANIFLYTRESFDARFRNPIDFIKANNPECRIIEIPCYSFRGYFPQTSPHVQEKSRFDIVQEIFNSFHREDCFINKEILQGKSTKEIQSDVLSGKTFQPEEIQRLLDLSLKQLSMMDRVSAIKVSDYVRANYAQKRLFKDPVHMEDDLVWYLTMQILDLLSCDKPSEPAGRTVHYFTELPIYPEVAKQLGLEWWHPELKYDLRMAEGMLKISTAEYIRRYIQFSANVNEIQKSLHINEGDAETVSEWF